MSIHESDFERWETASRHDALAEAHPTRAIGDAAEVVEGEEWASRMMSEGRSGAVEKSAITLLGPPRRVKFIEFPNYLTRQW